MSILGNIRKIIYRNNSVKNNLRKWSEWDWTQAGEEWSNNPQWKRSLVEHVLKPNMPHDGHILEIGPGAGRWTEYLIDKASTVSLVDLTPKCIDLCKKRFRNYTNIHYYVNDGTNLSFLPDGSIDFIWSWDVFVHIQSSDIRKYVREFARILKPGATALIHHSKNGTTKVGWRSDMTAQRMIDFCSESNLSVSRQFDSWDGGRTQIWPDLNPGEGPDIISILSRPNT